VSFSGFGMSVMLASENELGLALNCSYLFFNLAENDSLLFLILDCTDEDV
jgi:hypothetical protein